MSSYPNSSALVRRGCLLALALAAGLRASIGTDPGSPASPIIHLPQYTVKGAPVLPDKEAWRYLSIPGYEIISQATDARSAELAASLLRFQQVTARTFPAIRRTRPPTGRLILCTSRWEFEQFIPAAVRREIDPALVDRLFLTGTQPETAVLYLGNLTGGGDFAVDLANDYLRRRLATAQPPLPPWYIEGIARIFAAAGVTDWRSHETIAVGKLDDRPPPQASVPSSDGAMNVSPVDRVDSAQKITTDVATIVRGDLLALAAAPPGAPVDPAAANPDFYGLSFRRYFLESNRPPPSLAALFAGPPAIGYADWSQGCCLFVHYCLFGQRGKYTHALEAYFDHLTPGADPAVAFRAAFGKSFADMDRLLAYSLGASSYQVMQFKVPAAAAGRASAALREATDGEIADLKAGAEGNAGFPERAMNELMAGYRRERAAGPIEPRLAAALGSAANLAAPPAGGR
jgi:hypothetical protein